ncbi:MAG: glutamyl-tRNA reductase [Chloroflexota bacterium]
MEIIVVGVDHTTAPVALREQITFTPSQMDAALAALREVAAEVALLSTCNRTEIYAVVPRGDAGPREVASFLARFHRLPMDTLAPHLFSLVGEEAVGHLFAVASGLESMILGEPQVLGQVRQAHDDARARGSVGPILSRVFLQALKAGKRVRTETGISRNAVSVSHAAVELARQILGGLEGRSVLLIGAGEMAELAARNLVDNGAARLVIINRTHRRAVELASRIGAEAADFPRLPELLAEADVAVSSTGAPGFILTPQVVREAVAGRGDRPLFLIDIAVPRDVDPEVERLPDVFVHDIDDLRSLCVANQDERRKEAERGREIVDEEMETFRLWWQSLQVVPTIRALRDRLEEIRQAELRKALGRLGELSERQRSTLEALTSGIVNKILHQPTVRIKSCCPEQRGALYASALRELFDLEDGENPNVTIAAAREALVVAREAE